MGGVGGFGEEGHSIELLQAGAELGGTPLALLKLEEAGLSEVLYDDAGSVSLTMRITAPSAHS